MTGTASQPAPDGVFIIAEAGVNHNGKRELAFELIDAAADSGADAVKFQTFQADKMATARAPKANYQIKDTDAQESQLAMLRALELPREWHAALQGHARAKGIEFMSTAFDPDSLGFLINLGIERFKIPSGEICNGPLLIQFASSDRPLILSTGMATLSEIELALAVLAHGLATKREPQNLDEVWQGWSDPDRRALLNGKLSLLHCTSQYPTEMREVNLRAMDALRVFGLPVGYSDHTQGLVVSLAAVARGATIIEKHFTLDRNLPGPDHMASLEPDELKDMVTQLRAVSVALGNGMKSPQPSEWNTRAASRQAVVANIDIAAGTVFSRDMLGTARCGGGTLGTGLWDLVGCVATQSYAAGDAIP